MLHVLNKELIDNPPVHHELMCLLIFLHLFCQLLCVLLDLLSFTFLPLQVLLELLHSLLGLSEGFFLVTHIPESVFEFLIFLLEILDQHLLIPLLFLLEPHQLLVLLQVVLDSSLQVRYRFTLLLHLSFLGLQLRLQPLDLPLALLQLLRSLLIVVYLQLVFLYLLPEPFYVIFLVVDLVFQIIVLYHQHLHLLSLLFELHLHLELVGDCVLGLQLGTLQVTLGCIEGIFHLHQVLLFGRHVSTLLLQLRHLTLYCLLLRLDLSDFIHLFLDEAAELEECLDLDVKELKEGALLELFQLLGFLFRHLCDPRRRSG